MPGLVLYCFPCTQIGKNNNLITFLHRKETSPSFYILIPIDSYRSCLVLTWCRWDNGKDKGSTCISRFLFSFLFATMNSLNQTFDAAKSAILSLRLVIRIQYDWTYIRSGKDFNTAGLTSCNTQTTQSKQHCISLVRCMKPKLLCKHIAIVCFCIRKLLLYLNLKLYSNFIRILNSVL